MGETQPTYRDMDDQIEADRLSPFRRALRYKRQQAFDDVLDGIHQTEMAGNKMNHSDPEKAMVWCALVEQQRQINELREELGDG